jgi:peptidoglycan/xylan/chitin deacetylase (PgdA/CDA1 family)
MPSIRNTVLGASFASLALAHSTHKSKRGTVPFDGTIITSCVVPGAVALTFDDGPYDYSQSIVDQLTAAGHRATFFQNGKKETEVKRKRTEKNVVTDTRL